MTVLPVQCYLILSSISDPIDSDLRNTFLQLLLQDIPFICLKNKSISLWTSPNFLSNLQQNNNNIFNMSINYQS